MVVGNSDGKVNKKEAEAGKIVVTKIKDETIISRLMKDRTGWYLRPDNTTHRIIRPDSEDVGKNLEVEKVIIGLGHSNPGGLKMNLHQMIPKVFSNSNFPL